MKKFIVNKQDQVLEVEAELLFDLLCPPDLEKYKINGNIYYSWAVFDSKSKAFEKIKSTSI